MASFLQPAAAPIDFNLINMGTGQGQKAHTGIPAGRSGYAAQLALFPLQETDANAKFFTVRCGF
jgi:hypothetical protein